MLCLLGVCASRWAVWVLRVRALRSLWSLAGCCTEVQVGGGRMGIRAGLWFVGSRWLPVDGACWHGVWLEGLLVVVVRVRPPPPRFCGCVQWSVCREPVQWGQ